MPASAGECFFDAAARRGCMVVAAGTAAAADSIGLSILEL